MATSYLEALFDPIQIGDIYVRNRVVMPAMATCYATADGFVTDQLVSYYARRAEGGIGLIIVEAACVDYPVGVAIPHEVRIDDDKYVGGLAKLAAAMHAFGAKTAIQLHHAGPSTHFEGAQPVAPSPIPLRHTPHVIPRELSNQEIKAIIKKFASGAKRARQAGFDAVELLCAHGYLLNRFLSPHANKRRDEYGGSREGRVRIIQEIIDSIRAEAGAGLPILCKVPGDDYVDGGITLEESTAICKMLEELGVAAITVTGGSSEARFTHIGPMGYPEGWQVHLAQEVKRHVNIPIAAMGKIKKPEFAHELLVKKMADLVAMGRALIGDPDLVAKSQRNELDNIIPCISCNHCLDTIVEEGKPLRCSVNPITGREYYTRVVPVDRPRKVLVVGGGPAGMQAAIVAASRGHNVTLVEQNDKLGGQMLLAAMPPDKDEITPFINYLSNQLRKKKVKVKSKEKVTRRLVESIGPEVVVVATGAAPLVPAIPGAKLGNVISSWDALLNPEKIGDRVVVIGGGMVGCEVASFLAQRGKKVTIVEQLQDMGLDIGPSTRKWTLQRLEQQGITIMTKAMATDVSEKGVTISRDGESALVNADTVVIAMGAKSDRELLETLESARVEVRAIGDCVAPRRIVQATSHGFDVGCRL